MTTTPREKPIHEAILRYLKALPDCYAEKRWGGQFGNAGKPDVTGCIHGRRFEFEVKRPGIDEPSPLQAKELSRWEKAGAIVGVVHSVQEVKGILHQHGLIREEDR